MTTEPPSPMSDNEAERGRGGAYPTETESRRTPADEGEPPRPANEPPGAEGSSRPNPQAPSDRETARETITDPSTGAPLDPAA